MLARKIVFSVMFALLMVSAAAQAGGDAANGEKLAANCVDCHGADGKGIDDAPAIAGLDETEHFEMLKGYKSGEREDEAGVMQMFTEELSEQDMADLAAYYATLGQ